MRLEWKVKTKLKDKEFLDRFRQQFNKVVVEMLGDAKRYAPVDKGLLRRRIELDKKGDLHYELWSHVPYSAHVEYGTSPHIIRPVNAQALRFETGKAVSGFGRTWARGGGGVVYAKKVKHPGTSPQPFMRPALEIAKSKIRRFEAFYKKA
ncbi:MAG: hypothetical protein KKD77_20180 [Gammaproteobacteria bacterium]|nr:hypothetical protein [Gammaproteobacteria bacterium]